MRLVDVRVFRMGGAPMPKRAHKGDSGYDLMYWHHPVVIEPGETFVVGCGIKIELPLGYEAQVRPRSGMSSRGIICPVGTIDSCYRGEIKAILTNHSNTPYTVQPGARIAQLVVQQVPKTVLVDVDTLTETDRGDSGFGGSGE